MKPWLKFLLFFAAIAVIFFLPILKNADFWGVRDWGWHLYINTIPKDTLLKHKELPLWDPYRCGGIPVLAHPEGPVFSSYFLLVLLLPTMFAFKLGIIVTIMIGAFGMWLLCRRFELSVKASVFAAAIFTLNSSFFLYYAEGTWWYRGFMWLPYIAYFYLKCEDSLKNAIPTAVFLLLVLFDTNTYAFAVVLYFLGLWALLTAVVKKKPMYLLAPVLVVVFALLLGAAKIIPLLNYTIQFPANVVDNESGYTLKSLFTGLLSREQGPYSHWFEDKRPFFHHGIYIGWIGLVAGLLGLLMFWKSQFRMLLLFVITLVVAFGKNAIINLYALLKLLPPYHFFHEATRFMPLAMMAFALFAGMLLSRFEKASAVNFGFFRLEQKHAKIAVAAIVVLLLLDLWLVNTAVLPKIFIATPKMLGEKSSEFYLFNPPYGSNPWADGQVTQQLYENVWGHRMFIEYENGRGISKANCHGNVGLNSQPRYFEDGSNNPSYKGETYLLNGKGNARIVEFSPNWFRIAVNATAADTLVLNQNYYNEWRAEGAKSEAKTANGLLSAEVDTTTKEVTFYYSKKLFIIGFLISLVSIAAVIVAFRKWDRIEAHLPLLKQRL